MPQYVIEREYKPTEAKAYSMQRSRSTRQFSNSVRLVGTWAA